MAKDRKLYEHTIVAKHCDDTNGASGIVNGNENEKNKLQEFKTIDDNLENNVENGNDKSM